ncbi:hypothetical protein H839_08094 [Parageobacillus genomosp. 1]|uniref:Uncharacterized protein n=1 Tax=Parageobacillus genomosp. 1 TaxID=1295642 RepID=A0ABC9VGE5_9BACL|nr:hypothetical protein [Parageobacillus genomosp. 1]EZP77578.1 hypothetical protein H839_08094 [Parageobacillus genomosp. 1]
MEPVKLTPKQAETFQKVVEIVNQEPSLWPLLTQILRNGYEIEEPFKVGDWVVWLGDICEIVRFQCDTPMKDDGRCYLTLKRLADGEEFYNTPREDVRLATEKEIAAEKERRRWAAIGREVGEYHAGDFVRHKRYGIDMVEFVDVENGPYLRGLKRCVDDNEIELICPVEHRFDVKGDDDESA